ncbi:MAG: O-antigen ligase family protein, partial [Coraliomargarita sp.]|nr:O-antigen ligase family protein [Coraliomargarita sp.]
MLFKFAYTYRPTGLQRARCIRLLAGALLILGIGSIIAAKLGITLPWANRVHVFSWFPNRNQSALVFASGSVLLFGLAFLPWYRQRIDSSAPTFRSIWIHTILRALLGSLLLYALFLSLSKGALIAWCVGMFALVFLTVISTNSKHLGLLRVLPAFAILLFAFFVFFGGKSRERLVEFIASPPSALATETERSANFRWQIYVESTSLIVDQPWAGVGLGQFQYIFPQYRRIPAAHVAILHPESDFFWWASELGIIGLSLITLCLGSLLLRLKPKADKDRGSLDHYYRCIAIAALTPIFVHGLVDVGGHRIGTVLLAIILYTVALPNDASLLRPSPIYQYLWRFTGLAVLLIGALLLTLAELRSPLLKAYAPKANEPLQSRPLQWQPYFRSAGQSYANDRKVALHDFQKARFLVADNSLVPFEEGSFLFRVGDYKQAFAAFTSALRRSEQPVETYRRILRRTRFSADHREELRNLANMDAKLVAAYWEAFPTREVNTRETMQSLRRDWKTITGAGQKRILERLNRHKLPQITLSLFEISAPEKHQQSWTAAMQAHVEIGEWEEALNILNQWVMHKNISTKPITDYELKRLQS